MQTFSFDTRDTAHTVWLTKPGEYRVELNAPGVELEIKGGWHTKGTERVALTLNIVHNAPHTLSRTLLRGVADDRSSLDLAGTIIVNPGAQHINAFLTENILLLSEKAVANATPNLEIEAHEVKCSHAATISKIPEEYIFYLQSRGIERKQAEQIIVDGFLGEVQEKALRGGDET
jgi:Fe-S cluster assembly protein SufD